MSTSSISSILTGIVFYTCLTMAGLAHAENAYVDDNLSVGLHESNTVDSPIIKIIRAATPLEIIKQESPLSQVRDPEGTSGWIDNKYLTQDIPARIQLDEAQKRIHSLEQQINMPATDNTNDNSGLLGAIEPVPAASPGLDKLQNELTAEKLHAGELQAQIVELRNQLDAASKQTQETDKPPNIEIDNNSWLSFIKNNTDHRQKLFILVMTSLLVGFLAGFFLLDRYNRQRQGGFRIR